MSLLGFIGLGIMAKNALTPKWSASKGAAEYRKQHPLIHPVAGKLYGDYSYTYKPYQFISTKIPVRADTIPDGTYTITMPNGKRVTRKYKTYYETTYSGSKCILEVDSNNCNYDMKFKTKIILKDENCNSVVWEDTTGRKAILDIGHEQEINILNAKEKIKMYERYDRECDLDKIAKLKKVIKNNEEILNNQKDYIEETKMFTQFFENCTFDMYKRFNDLECWDAFLGQISCNSKNTKHYVSDEEKQIVWGTLKKDVVKDELRVNEKETRKFIKSEWEKKSFAINAANSVIFKYRLSQWREDTILSLDDLREIYEKNMEKYNKYSSLGWW